MTTAVSESLLNDIDAYIDEIWPHVLNDIDTLLRINSIEDLSHATDECPWGPAAKEALLASMDIAERLGLTVTNVDNRLAFGDVPGSSGPDRYLATIAHSDIVPVGEGWHFPPLKLTKKDGYLIGRGVLDDKGPLVLSMWCAHYFLRKSKAGEKLPYTLRCIIGNNEETGMSDVDYYISHYPEPLFCFTPDANFPVICGEKGIYQAQFESKQIAGDTLISLTGGTVVNAIPSTARAHIRALASKLPAKEHISIKDAGNGTSVVTAQGIGGHASMPAGSLNAIGLLCRYLLSAVELNEHERNFLKLQELLTKDSAGKALSIAASDDKFGALTCIAGALSTSDDKFIQTIDIRYPTTITDDSITDTMTKTGAGYGCGFSLLHNMTPFYIEPSSPEIQGLLQIYSRISGNEGFAFTIGGGTYARHFRRACAFGPHEQGSIDHSWIGSEHGPDEGIQEEALRRALKIYIASVAYLMKLEY